MLKLWPSSPAPSLPSAGASTSTSNSASDMTPRAASSDRNPFDALSLPKAPARTAPSSHHPLLTPTRLSSSQYSPFVPAQAQTSANYHDLTPIGSPTTTLSIDAPDFSIPSTMPLSLPPSKLQNAKLPEQEPTLDSPPKESVEQTPNGTPSNSSLGQVHVKLIQARGLNIATSNAKPYVVVQFEQNEFVSRDPIDESEREVRGIPRPAMGSRQNSYQVAPLPPPAAQPPAATATSNAMSALGAISDAHDRRKSSSTSGSSGNPSPSTSVKSSSSSGAPRPTSLNNGIFGRIASSPVWKHEVSFDVTSHSSSINFNVYDRNEEAHVGFLGTLQVKHSFKDGVSVDRWFKLRPFETEVVTGEMRVQITFEKNKSKSALTPKDFEFLKLIGRGTFGRVFQVRKVDTKRIYAMKVLSKKEIVAKKEVAHTIGERKILQRSLSCAFLVGLKFSFQTDRDLYLVTDFKSGGELFWHLQKETRFTEERARFYISELVLALEHLHKYDIVYRDLKPENILLDATGHIALCDFGLSKPDLPSNELTTTFCGTTEYLAPEILLDEHGYGKVVDFWSLGVLLFEMCCGWSPFYAEDTQQMYKNICFGKIRFPKGVINEDGKMFVKGLLNRNPKHRLGALRDAAELKEHPFFRDVDWDALARKQITPPFKPNVESDESTNNFDPEFTESDIGQLVSGFGMDSDDEGGEWLDEADPSEEWVTGSLSNNIEKAHHGPLGSDRKEPLSRSSSTRSNTKIGSLSRKESGNHGRVGGISINGKKNGAAKKGKAGATSESVLSHSMQENFRGFTFSGGESVGAITGRGGTASGNASGAESGEEGVTEDELEDAGKTAGRYAHTRRKGFGFTEIDD